MRPYGVLESSAQLKAIGDPIRLDILRRLMTAPMTLTQLGAALGKHPAWVRHHVTVLSSADLVEMVEERRVGNYTEKYWAATAGAYGTHLLLTPQSGDDALVFVGSDDLALSALAEEVESAKGTVVTVPVGSLQGLIALREGVADVAGCHLLDVDSDEYNLPYVRRFFPDRAVQVVTLVEREQGLVVATGNPLGLTGLEDLAQDGVSFVNRIGGSGTRLWLDRRLREAGLSHESLTGYDREVRTHAAVAKLVADGQADAGLAVRAVAEDAGLGFIPLFTERYDIVFDASRAEEPGFKRLLDALSGVKFRRRAEALGGYDVNLTGRSERVAV